MLSHVFMEASHSLCVCVHIRETGGTHRHLHLELILVELEEDVGEGALQEGGGPQNQNQLEVPREGALKSKRRPA